MTVTGRLPLLVALGGIAVVLDPARRTVLIWLLLCLGLVLLDVLLALSPRRLTIVREPAGQVRLGEAGSSALLVTNPTQRTLRGRVRDAWQPSAGPGTDRHTLRLRGGERRRLVTPLRPTRRGDRRADRVTVRSVGPLGLAYRRLRRH